MAPKRKKVLVQEDDDSGSDYQLEPSESEPSEPSDYEDEKPKGRGRKATKATPQRKAAKRGPDEDEAWQPGSSGRKAKTAASKVTAAASKVTAVTPVANGWTLHPPSLIYKLVPEAQGGTKVAAFDLDGTLVGTKSGSQFAQGAADWKLFNKTVPKVLKDLVEDGYQLVIFSNQGGVKGALSGAASSNLRERVDNIIVALEEKAKCRLPVQVFAATQKDGNRKPELGMWEFFTRHANKGVEPDLTQSFYVGDAAGRPTDISNGSSSDKDFAAAIGVPFFLPEEKFGPSDIKATFEGGGTSTGKNVPLATAFRQLAALCAGEPFKVGAFKKVADIIDAFPDVITSAKQVDKIKGVGKSSVAKITEFLETGTIAALEENGIVAGEQPVDAAAEVGLRFL